MQDLLPEWSFREDLDSYIESDCDYDKDCDEAPGSDDESVFRVDESACDEERDDGDCTTDSAGEKQFRKCEHESQEQQCEDG